jgi:hypothetical protein
VTLHDGRFSMTLLLEASRRGSDREGRRYTVRVIATGTGGQRATATAIATVAHDRRSR